MKKIWLILLSGFISINAYSIEDIMHPKQMKWSFDGFFGTVNRQSAQRGYQVYKEVCSACHSMNLIAYRSLGNLGFTEEEIKGLADDHDVRDGPNDTGDMFERPGIPSDHFPNPYPNEKASRAANNGAYPPDLSLIIKARHDGANYVYSLLTGFNQTPPTNMDISDGMYYNPYFSGMQIAMAPPLSDGMITYQDGTNATVDQMARDVVNFLQWVAEPEMEVRKRMGIKTMIFLFIFTAIWFVAKQIIWSKLKR